MKHFFILLTLTIALPKIMTGQSISSYVISSAGDAIMSDDGALYLSIGEPLNTELNDGNGTVSQGFLQVSYAGDRLSSSEELLEEKIKVYPNPTVQEIHFSLEGASTDYGCMVYNLNGQLLLHKRTLTKPSINVSEFPSGTYFVTLQKDSKVSETIKIIKL